MDHSYGRSDHLCKMFVSPDTKAVTEDTNEILSYLSRAHLDRLTEAGWDAAGRVIAHSISAGDFPHLCVYDPDVLDLASADQYHIRQCLAFFSKRVDIDIGVDREATAVGKFRDAEAACKLTNECFKAFEKGTFDFPWNVAPILYRAQRKIQMLLDKVSIRHGWVDPMGKPRAPTLSEIDVRFGPGGSSQTPKRKACVAVKLSQAPACSANFFGSIREAAETLPMLFEPGAAIDCEIHDAVLQFVDKNAKTSRAICIEPQLNSLFQLGMDAILKEALLLVGIDLTDQTANQRGALYGSLLGYSATVDLQSASDTVARLLVRFLFPEDWYDIINRMRSERVEYNGEHIVLEKLSSMGNGTTFPVESLIFWALAQSATDVSPNPRGLRVLVYGDDIVLPSAAYGLLCEVLSSVGFTPNAKKSFATGTFRESCGHDYVLGTNVRPCYVADVLSTLDVMRLHNWYYSRGDLRQCAYLAGLLHPDVALVGPQGYGDGHLHSEYWAAKPVGRAKGWSGFHFETWLSKPKLLEEAAIRALTCMPRKNKDEKRKLKSVLWGEKGKVTWADKLARRIATYAVMVNHNVNDDALDTPVRGSGDSASWPNWVKSSNSDKRREAHAGYLRRSRESRPLTDLSHFITPGAEWVAKTFVYVLEPPYITL